MDESSLQSNPNLDRVLEPREKVVVAAASRRRRPRDADVLGFGIQFVGPARPTWGMMNRSGQLHTVASSATSDCYNAAPSHDCCVMTVAGARPAARWDATFDEDLEPDPHADLDLRDGDPSRGVQRHTVLRVVEEAPSSTTGTAGSTASGSLPGQLGDARADGGVPAQGRARPELHAAAVHAGDLRRRGVPEPLRGLDPAARQPRASPRAAAAATTARTTR